MTVDNAPTKAAPQPAPGWYRDPGGSGQLRYWDGGAWTTHVQPQAPVPGHTVVHVKKGGKGPLVALSFGLFLLAWPALIFPPAAFLIWLTSVITLIVALTR